MATMRLMRKALHMGTMETERAERIFLEDSRRPKSRTTRRARRMLTGKSMGPRTTRDMPTMTASKTDQVLARKGRSQLEKRLAISSKVKTTVKPTLRRSRVSLMREGEPSGSWSFSGSICASATETTKFCVWPRDH
jgi:ATP-dependent Clp protease ATP-binding subunit ClpA